MAIKYVKQISYEVQPVGNDGYAGFGVITEQKLRKGEPVGEPVLVNCIQMTEVLPKRGIAQLVLGEKVWLIDMNLQLMDINQ